MTGEMYASDVTEEAYPLHFAIAKALGGAVKPFDQYQGPYVVVGADLRGGDEPYQIAPRGLGIVRLWLMGDGDGFCTVYNEANEKESEAFPEDHALSPELAVAAAESVVSA